MEILYSGYIETQRFGLGFTLVGSILSVLVTFAPLFKAGANAYFVFFVNIIYFGFDWFFGDEFLQRERDIQKWVG